MIAVCFVVYCAFVLLCFVVWFIVVLLVLLFGWEFVGCCIVGLAHVVGLLGLLFLAFCLFGYLLRC